VYANKIAFFIITALTAITISPLVGGAAAVIGALAGMQGPSLVVLFGSASTAAFAAILALAGLAAGLFFDRF
jgi:hypothetical protein